MQIDYCFDMQALGALEVDDIGNCFVEANTDLNERYYFATITKYGLTRMVMYGPIDSVPELTLKYKVTYEKLDYDIRKLKKALYGMLNNPNYKITQAKIIGRDEFFDEFHDPLSFLKDAENERIAELD